MPEPFYGCPASFSGSAGRIVDAALRRFASEGLGPRSLAITLIVPGEGGAPPFGDGYRAGASFYPASVIKLFYMAAAFGLIEAGRMAPSAEIGHALSVMIRQSSNDATSYIVDRLTGTTGGPELEPAALARWLRRRRSVNRFFEGWHWPELADFNATQKTWEDAPYGRERQSRFDVPRNRNRLTTDATARLLWAIMRGQAVSPSASASMRRLLRRDLRRPDNQIEGFLGEGLPAGSQIRSKAGWTSRTRHDAAIVRLPNGRRFILVAFTSGKAASANRHLLPFIAKLISDSI